MNTTPTDANELILTREQVRECDRVAMERFAIAGLVLMENAGLGASRYILALLDRDYQDHPGRVFIAAGTGNNAGDGFVVARHLTNAGIVVDVAVFGDRGRIKGDAMSNLIVIEKMAVPICFVEQPDPDVAKTTVERLAGPARLVVDALLGTGTAGPPREPIRSAIEAINNARKPVVAIDIPSGLDCDTGRSLTPAICAAHTITFAASKKGFTHSRARRYTGDVTVVSIGIDTARLCSAAQKHGEQPAE